MRAAVAACAQSMPISELPCARPTGLVLRRRGVTFSNRVVASIVHP